MNTRPESAVPGYVACAGVLGAVGGWGLVLLLQPPSVLASLLFLSSCALPMWWLEIQRIVAPPRPSVKTARPEWRRHLRLLGLLVLMALFSAATYIFHAFAPDYLTGLQHQLLVLLALAATWIAWMLLRRPRGKGLDALESLGLAISRFRRSQHKLTTKDRQTLLGWLVKAFYLPLMLSSSYVFLQAAIGSISSEHGWWKYFSVAYLSMFAVDTAFATIGYCSTSRRIGAHIRSTEPTVLGWTAALICYPPLNLIVLHQWLSYHDGYQWKDWLSGSPGMLVFWGLAILAMTGLYVWATVAFGPRFSNLTHRGIITSGPYRYFKHPSYLGKNVAWWLISVPFLPHMGATAALANCAALLAINAIYWLRASTEENHLLRDPVYQAYSDWIDQHGAFARLARLFRRRVKVPT